VHSPGRYVHRKKSNFRAYFWWVGDIWRVGAVNWVVLVCVLRATTKKVVNFFRGKRTSQRNSWLRLWKRHDIIVRCVLIVCTVVANSTAVSDAAGARRLGNASIGMSIAGIVVTVLIIIIAVAVSLSSPSTCRYRYNGTCYNYRSSYYYGTSTCYGRIDYLNDYCYYNWCPAQDQS